MQRLAWRSPLGALLALLGLWLLAAPALAQAPRPVPALSGRVIDQTSTLSEPQREALERKLAAFEARSGPQIVVLLVPSTQPEDIAAYAYRVADTWKIGRREVGDGLILLVAKDDRRARIEVARALEGAVPDLAARQIIDQALAPAFRQDDYAGGLNLALDRLFARISGEALPAPAGRAADRSTDPVSALGVWFWPLLIGVPLLITLMRALMGPGRTALLLGSGTALGVGLWGSLFMGLVAGAVVAVLSLIGVGSLLQIVLSSQGGGGGRGGGGGGGGFSSGGGGSFGGGGASGGW